MQKGYYQNILYPLQNKVLEMMERLPVDFYLTGGTALSRAYLNHRYSDDLDFVNDVPFRSGAPAITEIYRFTDTPVNILINKITALPRLEAKDVADIVFISLKYSFNWASVISEAAEKDMWVNPPETARILDEFPVERLTIINWIDQAPDPLWFGSQLRIIIKDILQGNNNTLYREERIV